jgi:hypothetical protein
MSGFFISRAGEDRATALFVSSILRDAGHDTFMQEDFGNVSFMEQINNGFAMVDGGARLIAILSRSYLRSEYCWKECNYPLIRDPLNKQGRLIVLRIENCEPSGLLKDIPYTDLVPFLQSPLEFRLSILDAIASRNSELTGVSVSIPIHAKLNQETTRLASVQTFSGELASSPIDETRFINFYDCVEEANWFVGSGVVQTTSVEFRELWADPRYFTAYEASLVMFARKGLDVHRLFVLSPEVQHNNNLRAEFQKVIVRHELLRLNPRVLVRHDALDVNKKIAIDCDAFAIVDQSTMLLVRLPSRRGGSLISASIHEPITLKTTNKKLCLRASNVFTEFWNKTQGADYLRRQWGALPKKYMKSIEEEARQIEIYCKLYVDYTPR